MTYLYISLSISAVLLAFHCGHERRYGQANLWSVVWLVLLLLALLS